MIKITNLPAKASLENVIHWLEQKLGKDAKYDPKKIVLDRDSTGHSLRRAWMACSD